MEPLLDGQPRAQLTAAPPAPANYPVRNGPAIVPTFVCTFPAGRPLHVLLFWGRLVHRRDWDWAVRLAPPCVLTHLEPGDSSVAFSKRTNRVLVPKPETVPLGRGRHGRDADGACVGGGGRRGGGSPAGLPGTRRRNSISRTLRRPGRGIPAIRASSRQRTIGLNVLRPPCAPLWLVVAVRVSCVVDALAINVASEACVSSWA